MSAGFTVNPWRSLPLIAPFVLPSDATAIDQFNSKADCTKQFDLSLLPEPFTGSPAAPILLLALNPGLSDGDAQVHSTPRFIEQIRRSLVHELNPYPFLHLQPDQETSPGAKWWRRIAKSLIADLGFNAVSKNIFCIQYFPYHSKTYGSGKLDIIDSQRYSFDLVRAAIQRRAEIVIMRSSGLWLAAIPELTSYSRIHCVKNPRNPTLSPKNLGEVSYKSLSDRIRA